MRRLGIARRDDGSTHIRPGGALVLCSIVWLLCAATILESLWVLGVHGWWYMVLPLAVSAVVWALLWAPRVVLHEDRIEVRNVLVTHVLPMAAIEDVRLAAMLRLILPPRQPGGKPEVITAWNAPGVGKDRPRERITRSDVRSRYSEDDPAHSAPSSWSERLVRDQRESPSFAVVEAWERWSRGGQGRDGAASRGHLVSAPSRHLNAVVLVVIGAAGLLMIARMVFPP